jgi:hypothetical protein
MSSRRQAKTIRLELPRPHAGQREIIANARRFNVVTCGRRWGKTMLAMDRLAPPALRAFPVAYFTPTYRMLAEVWRATNRLLKPVISAKSVQEKRLELITGGALEFWSLDRPDTARGRKYKRVVIDEAAMVRDLQTVWQAIIRPTLTDYQGDGWLLSTPRGLNYYFDLFNRGQDPSDELWASWQKPTLTNPYIPPSEIEIARRDLAELTFQQEYLALFVQHAGAVFRNVEACLTSIPTCPDEHRGHRKVMGVDWAQIGDFTVLCVFCATCMRELELDRFNQISWSLQRGRLIALAEKWRVEDILVEANSVGGPNIEALWEEEMAVEFDAEDEDEARAAAYDRAKAKVGLAAAELTPLMTSLPLRSFTTTAASKPMIVRSLALCFEKEEAKWLDDPVAKAELLAFEQKLSRLTGRATFSAPEGGHDDTVIARCLAWEAAAHTPILSVA